MRKQTKVYPNKARQSATSTGHITPASPYAILYQIQPYHPLTHQISQMSPQKSIPINEKQELKDAKRKEETNLVEDHEMRMNRAIVA